jgi:tRNA(Arg) A34 adenosine deaminase TadA
MSADRFPVVHLKLPAWVEAFVQAGPQRYRTAEDRMRLAIDLSHLSIERGGGPFGAAVFERSSGRLVAPGVNMVVKSRCSLLHAELVALAVAQKILGRYDLGGGAAAYELASSTEPCAMCMGAIPWSGIGSLLCGARGADAVRIGFDEGSKPAAWVRAFRSRGIKVRRDVCRAEARLVLREYKARGGVIYSRAV